MSEEKHFENDPERTLITLEQLSQTIEVMTSVVNRLRQHLSDQLHAQMEEQQEQKKLAETQAKSDAHSHDATPPTDSLKPHQKDEPSAKASADEASKKKSSFVVEIRQQDDDIVRKNGKTLH